MSDEEFAKYAQEQVNQMEAKGFWLGMKPRKTTVCSCYPVVINETVDGKPITYTSHANECAAWLPTWRLRSAAKDMTNA